MVPFLGTMLWSCSKKWLINNWFYRFIRHTSSKLLTENYINCISICVKRPWHFVVVIGSIVSVESSARHRRGQSLEMGEWVGTKLVENSRQHLRDLCNNKKCYRNVQQQKINKNVQQQKIYKNVQQQKINKNVQQQKIY